MAGQYNFVSCYRMCEYVSRNGPWNAKRKQSTVLLIPEGHRLSVCGFVKSKILGNIQLLIGLRIQNKERRSHVGQLQRPIDRKRVFAELSEVGFMNRTSNALCIIAIMTKLSSVRYFVIFDYCFLITLIVPDRSDKGAITSHSVAS